MIKIKRKLEKKVILFFLGSVLLSIVITTLVAVDISVRMIIRSTIDSLMTNAQKVSSDVTREVVLKLDNLNNFAKVQALFPASDKTVRDRFYLFLSIQPFINKGQLLDKDGKEVFTISRSSRIISRKIDYSKNNRFVIANINGSYISPVYTNEYGKRSIMISTRIGQDLAHSKGVVAIEISLVHLLRIIEDENSLKRIIYIVDNRGDIVAYPNYGWVLKRKNLSKIKTVQENMRGIKEERVHYHKYLSPEGIMVLGVHTHVPYLGWGVIIEEPYSFIFKPIYKMIKRIGLLSFCITLIVTVLGVIIVRRKIKPLEILHDSAEKIKNGNLDIVIKAGTGDEIEDLANAFNVMTGKLKEMYDGQEMVIAERTSQLKTTQERLLYSEKLATIGKLASTVGHELRNPLAIIKNSVYYLNMLDIGKVSEDAKEQLDIIEKETDAANQIISEILDFTREKEPNLIKSNVNLMIKNMLTKIPIPREVAVRTDFRVDNPELMLDPVLMGRVLQNIAVNAVQAMPKGGDLTITTMKTKELFWVVFKDTGSGILQKDLQKIFEPLFTTKARGTGLGLTLCKNIVEKHGGKIKVESTPGKGTTMILEFPVIV